MKPKYLFWTEGDETKGLGLVVRMIAIAGKLKKKCDISFFVNANRHAVKKVKDAGFPFRKFASAGNADGKEALLKRLRPDAVVTDIKRPEDSFFKKLKDITGSKIATFDELNRVKLHSDLVINYNTFNPARKYVSGLSTTRFLFGPTYMVLRDEFRRLKPRPMRPKVRRIFVAYGGSDPLVLTPKTVEALSTLPGPLDIHVVLGAAFPFHAELRRALKACPHKVRVEQDVRDMARRIQPADLVITAGGTIMYESLYLKKPVITVCQAPHQDEFADQLDKRGAVLNLGLGSAVRAEAIAKAVRCLSASLSRRRALVKAGSRTIDGRGAERLASVLLKMTEKK